MSRPAQPAEPKTATRKKAERKSPAERSTEIADAARALALEQGLSAITLRGIAARIDVAPALVAHYQPSMETLVAATFESIVGAEIDEIVALLAAHVSPRSRMTALLDTLLDGTRDDVTVVWVESWVLGRRNEALAAAVREQMDSWRRVIHDVVDAGVASGDFTTDDAASVSWQLLGMIDGLNAHALVHWEDSGHRGSRLNHAVEGMLGLERGELAASLGDG